MTAEQEKDFKIMDKNSVLRLCWARIEKGL